MGDNLRSGQLSAVASEVADSRGRPTVSVRLSLGQHTASGDVPAGASKGQDEAQTVPVAAALAHIEQRILPLWQKLDLPLSTHRHVIALEEATIAAAGPNFAQLGANATLPMSRALWRLAAAAAGLPLWAYIRRAEPDLARQGRVLFLMNIFNGGLHALRPEQGERLGVDRIEIQEIMVVPMRAATYAQAMSIGERVDQALKAALLGKYGPERVSRADEAGFSVRGLGDNQEAVGWVSAAIEQAGFVPGVDVKLALDVAASSFYDEAAGHYALGGGKLSSAAMRQQLQQMVAANPQLWLSVEDGLAENDWEGWAKLTQSMRQLQVVTVGDDLFVTQLPRLARGIAAGAADAVLIKVNQNGTVHGTLQVMKAARAAGLHCIISHRSGETLDDSISDLAYATGAFGLKTGDPQPPADFPDPSQWVRRAKYLRMVAIEQDEAGRSA